MKASRRAQGMAISTGSEGKQSQVRAAVHTHRECFRTSVPSNKHKGLYRFPHLR